MSSKLVPISATPWTYWPEPGGEKTTGVCVKLESSTCVTRGGELARTLLLPLSVAQMLVTSALQEIGYAQVQWQAEFINISSVPISCRLCGLRRALLYRKWDFVDQDDILNETLGPQYHLRPPISGFELLNMPPSLFPTRNQLLYTYFSSTPVLAPPNSLNLYPYNPLCLHSTCVSLALIFPSSYSN
ncbi:unnamed protein product [Calicophoron daubneyi]|uniref:Uncharacterized protein n=1 Tax=Calicophoron daubneyi TaxID=300641 RepID=A0AAV2TSJ2_CALDB